MSSRVTALLMFSVWLAAVLRTNENVLVKLTRCLLATLDCQAGAASTRLDHTASQQAYSNVLLVRKWSVIGEASKVDLNGHTSALTHADESIQQRPRTIHLKTGMHSSSTKPFGQLTTLSACHTHCTPHACNATSPLLPVSVCHSMQAGRPIVPGKLTAARSFSSC